MCHWDALRNPFVCSVSRPFARSRARGSKTPNKRPFIRGVFLLTGLSGDESGGAFAFPLFGRCLAQMWRSATQIVQLACPWEAEVAEELAVAAAPDFHPFLRSITAFSTRQPSDAKPLSTGLYRRELQCPRMDHLTSRKEFRLILSSVVRCTRANLDRPGITPFTPEEVFHWFQRITLEDVRAAFEGLKKMIVPPKPLALYSNCSS